MFDDEQLKRLQPGFRSNANEAGHSSFAAGSSKRLYWGGSNAYAWRVALRIGCLAMGEEGFISLVYSKLEMAATGGEAKRARVRDQRKKRAKSKAQEAKVKRTRGHRQLMNKYAEMDKMAAEGGAGAMYESRAH